MLAGNSPGGGCSANSVCRILQTYPTFIGSLVIILATLVGIISFNHITVNRDYPYWDNETSYGRCEQTLGNENNFLREPANALSNLVFMWVGVYAILTGLYDFRHFRNLETLESGGNNKTKLNGGFGLTPLLSVAYGELR